PPGTRRRRSRRRATPAGLARGRCPWSASRALVGPFLFHDCPNRLQEERQPDRLEENSVGLEAGALKPRVARSERAGDQDPAMPCLGVRPQSIRQASRLLPGELQLRDEKVRLKRLEPGGGLLWIPRRRDIEAGREGVQRFRREREDLVIVVQDERTEPPARFSADRPVSPAKAKSAGG